MILLEEKLYTSEETASVLGISLRTLYRYLKKGEIEAETKTQSGTFRFTRKQIYKYLYPDKFTEILQKLKESEPSSGRKILYFDDLSAISATPSSTNQTPAPVDSSEDQLDLKVSFNAVGDNVGNGAEENVDLVAESADTNTEVANNVNNKPNEDSKLTEESVVSKPFSPEEASKIKEERHNKGLDSELEDLASLLQSTKQNTPPQSSGVVASDSANANIPENKQTASDTVLKDLSNLAKQQNEIDTKTPPAGDKPFNINATPTKDLDTPLSHQQEENSVLNTTPGRNINQKPESVDLPNNNESTNPQVLNEQPVVSDESWLYFLNTEKDILDLAREINAISTETGRKYAATMKGGLSLHHDIEEFNIIHFYVPKDDFNWFVNELSLKPADEAQANICLIPTASNEIFDNSYKLRGLSVVSDSRLIQDLMSHNEKELAKTLL